MADLLQGNVNSEGACCNEMDIWEANSRANQIAPHVCAKEGLIRCSGTEDCGVAGVCGKTGCGDNAYNFRNSKDFYGPGLKVDTTRPFTVVTQFPAKYGVLQAIVRKYVQDGIVIENAMQNVTMDQVWCSAQSRAREYNKFGGHKTMGDALERGMVLVFSLWWDKTGGMTWLDGGLNGPCYSPRRTRYRPHTACGGLNEPPCQNGKPPYQNNPDEWHDGNGQGCGGLHDPCPLFITPVPNDTGNGNGQPCGGSDNPCPRLVTPIPHGDGNENGQPCGGSDNPCPTFVTPTFDDGEGDGEGDGN